MNYTNEELNYYADYIDYIELITGIDEIEWSNEVKWAVVINDNIKEVVSYHNWLKMLKREEKLNNLFKETIR